MCPAVLSIGINNIQGLTVVKLVGAGQTVFDSERSSA
jgi:hypothetical protein